MKNLINEPTSTTQSSSLLTELASYMANSTSFENYRLLMNAMYAKNTEAAIQLLPYIENLNIDVYQQGYHQLCTAIHFHNLKVVEALLAREDVNINGEQAGHPQMNASMSTQDRGIPLLKAIAFADTKEGMEILKRLLACKALMVNSFTNGTTKIIPLHEALKTNSVAVVEALLAREDLQFTKSSDECDFILDKINPEILRLVSRHKSCCDYFFERSGWWSSYGFNDLVAKTIKTDDPALVKVMLEHPQIDLNEACWNKESLLAVAQKKNNPAIIELVKEAYKTKGIALPAVSTDNTSGVDDSNTKSKRRIGLRNN